MLLDILVDAVFYQFDALAGFVYEVLLKLLGESVDLLLARLRGSTLHLFTYLFI